MFNPVTDYDFRFYSDDKNSHITFTLEEYVQNHLPSLSCSIEVSDNKFKGWNINVWFKLEELHKFISELQEFSKSRKGKVSLSAMSSDDFDITFESRNQKGDVITFYSLSKYNNEIPIKTTLTGGFQFDSEFLLKLIDDLKQFTSVAEIGTDITFI